MLKKSKGSSGVLLIALTLVFLPSTSLFAQGANLEAIESSKQLISSNPQGLQVPQLFDKLSQAYFGASQYQQFVQYLQGLRDAGNCPYLSHISYYIALSRYQQLKHLEQTQSWEEYFDSGKDYLEQIYQETRKAIAFSPTSPIALEAQYLNWLTHRQQRDGKEREAVNKLIEMLDAYCQRTKEPAIVKDMADRLYRDEELKYSHRLYGLYVSKLVEDQPLSDAIERLKRAADSAFHEEDFGLASTIYSHYIDLAIEGYPKQKAAIVLAEIANRFSHHGFSEGKDGGYAEWVYQKLEQVCGREGFSEESLYNRASNLLRQKDYQRAAEQYSAFIDSFPNSIYLSEAYFKLAVLYLYVLNRPEEALGILERILKKFPNSLYAKSSHYHIGLYHQWRTGAQIEYNLKVFLDLAFKEPIGPGYLGLGAKVDCWACPDKVFKDSSVTFTSKAQAYEVGTIQPTFDYLWSGDLGSTGDPGNVWRFISSYKTLGTKVVNVVALTTEGVGSRAIEIVDVYGVRISSSKDRDSFRLEDEVVFDAQIFPPTPIEAASWQWQITGPESISFTNVRFDYRFNKPGKYEVVVSASIDGLKGTSERLEFTVK